MSLAERSASSRRPLTGPPTLELNKAFFEAHVGGSSLQVKRKPMGELDY